MIAQTVKKMLLPALCVAAMAMTGCHSDGSGSTAKSEAMADPYERGAEMHPQSPARSEPARAQAKPVETKPAAAKPAAAKPAPVRRDGMQQVSMAFPTCDPSTSSIMLDKMLPYQVSVGEEFDYEIVVTNLMDCTAENVVVTDRIGDLMNVSSSNPRATSSNGGVTTWNLGSIEAGGTKSIMIKGTARDVGTITNCATVAWDTTICATIEVVRPALELVKSAPREVMLCDEIPVRFVVRNTGSGTASNVRINDPLPQGWTTRDGQRTVDISVGDLGPGESREYTVMATADRTGSFNNTAMAMSESLEVESGETTTIVRQPVLTITKDAPDLRYLGRNAEFTITVKNEGDGAANNVVITDTLPTNGTVVSVSDNGQVAGRNVNWNLGSLAPNASRTVSITMSANTTGTLRNTARVSGECADDATATAEVEYRGIPAILLEVIDISDPVEVGATTTYVIIATNQGSAIDRNVRIVCELPDSQSFVSAEGATNASTRGQTVTFAPLAALAPGQKATWRVTIRAEEEEDSRFGVSMTSDTFTRPVQETESTNLYR